MVFKLLFTRRSKSSFKIYVIHKHKICFPVLSGQLTVFKFGNKSISDVFVQNLITRKSAKCFRDIRFFNNCVKEFIEFVSYARNKKI